MSVHGHRNGPVPNTVGEAAPARGTCGTAAIAARLPPCMRSAAASSGEAGATFGGMPYALNGSPAAASMGATPNIWGMPYALNGSLPSAHRF